MFPEKNALQGIFLTIRKDNGKLPFNP